MTGLALAVAAILGTVAPEFSLFTPDGRQWRLSEILEDRPTVLLNASRCEEKLVLPDDVRLVAMRPSVCGGYRDPTGAARRFLGTAKAILISKDGVVRLATDGKLPPFAADVRTWSTGNSLAAVHCASCHASDKKPLANTGRRLKGAELQKRVQHPGGADLSRVDAHGRRALAFWLSTM